MYDHVNKSRQLFGLWESCW